MLLFRQKQLLKMGIYAHRFYFKEGLPKVDDIRSKFKEITGLHLEFTPYIHLDRLMTDYQDILDYLNDAVKNTNRIPINII